MIFHKCTLWPNYAIILMDCHVKTIQRGTYELKTKI